MPSRGEIYFADLDPVLGSEQGGIRPVLIIQNNVGNRYSPTVIVAAVTSSLKKNALPTHIDIGEFSGLSKRSYILLEQLRTLDKRRLRNKVGRLPEEVMFLLEDTAVVIMDTGKTYDGKEDFLDECIRILRGLLSELTEDADQEEGILMLQPGLWLDEKRHSVWEEDQEISVTRREYDVLYMLFRH